MLSGTLSIYVSSSIPAEHRFEGEEAFVSRNEVTGDEVLSDSPGAYVWRDFFDLMKTIEVPSDFMSERPMNVPPNERNLFKEE